MTRRWTVFAVVALLLSSVAWSADHDAAYYQRTGTKPPITGDFLLGPTLHYAEQFSPGVAFGYTWNEAGVTLLGDFNVVRIDGRSGAVPFSYRCHDFDVPYSVGGRMKGQVGVSVLFRLPKR